MWRLDELKDRINKKLDIPVKIATGRMISIVKPAYRSSYALVRYVSNRPYAKNVSSKIDVKSKVKEGTTVNLEILRKEEIITKIITRIQ